ncbi:histidine-type phosphatase [Pectobacterium aroidearum]|uniref:Histidine-type phosphatase n=1 Tax=Pectobacterium aroidearum TaxID=1201031 RepID=A0ABR5ZIU6_9GAMM|nr:MULTISPECIES: histidine-type phosphatase [Pectobacterium]MBA5201741.1 histidine-type phosphatase [Pectobacterium aroidearum]MBA5229992.1 histidine-type phosphatase [Pectobacterium aroidearum]MBA5234505.1 histidine-type phosphatase [Pectobacterium aroidearum]MBA5739708.1 histidine-type phosphatase [Pectobacterium aroidearum]UXK00096.1 histidine-type phosphatase [Pectobacterium aroidearum]
MLSHTTWRMPRTLLITMIIVSAFSAQAQAQDRYQLEKVVEVSRHGVRPPTESNTTTLESGTAREWPQWVTRDGELTGHGYAATVLKGRYEGEYYRQQHLFASGCPTEQQIYVLASPLQRTRATAQAYMDGMFPGCGVATHAVEDEKHDPLFHGDKMGIGTLDPERAKAEVLKAMGGDLNTAYQHLQPSIEQLKQIVCKADKPCPVFDKPWAIKQDKDGSISISGLNTLANMSEVFLLEYTENLPQAQVAFGHIRNTQDLTPLMAPMTAKYDFTNDVPYIAQRGGSLLMQQIAQALAQGTQEAQDTTQGEPPAAPYLLYVAHDTNIAYLRTLLPFHWQLPGDTADNIPPAGSLVFERWRDTTTQQRFLRVYFQAQSLDQIRSLTPLSDRQPLLKEELTSQGCQQTEKGTLCPFDTVLKSMRENIDSSALAPVHYAL